MQCTIRSIAKIHIDGTLLGSEKIVLSLESPCYEIYICLPGFICKCTGLYWFENWRQGYGR